MMATETETKDRRHTEVLLDISEEEWSKDLEPHDYHCRGGWEETVSGWDRVAPLSCILLTQTKSRRPQTGSDSSPKSPPADPTPPVTGGHGCERRMDRHHSLRKSIPLNQQVDPLSDSAVCEAPVFNGTQGRTSHIQLEVEGRLREPALQPRQLSPKHSKNKPPRPRRNDRRQNNSDKTSHKSNNTLVPITNLTFFPPIKPPHLLPKVRGHIWSGKKSEEGETLEDKCFLFDRRSDMRQVRLDSAVDTDFPLYRTCQHNPVLVSAISHSIPKTSVCTRVVK